MNKISVTNSRSSKTKITYLLQNCPSTTKSNPSPCLLLQKFKQIGANWSYKSFYRVTSFIHVYPHTGPKKKQMITQNNGKQTSITSDHCVLTLIAVDTQFEAYLCGGMKFKYFFFSLRTYELRGRGTTGFVICIVYYFHIIIQI